MARCLVIEDDAETGQYMVRGLREAGHNVTLLTDGADGVALSTLERWDIVILDRLLPGRIDGIEIVQALREFGDSTPILIVSALAAVDERIRGLRAGGDDYLAKPFAFSEFLARVDALLRRPALQIEVGELTVADLTLDLKARRVSRGGQIIPLQPREFRLLEYLVRHQGQVVTRSMMLDAVWDYHFDPQTGVVDVQISRLRGKIDKGFDRPLIHTVRGAGYIVSSDAPLA